MEASARVQHELCQAALVAESVLEFDSTAVAQDANNAAFAIVDPSGSAGEPLFHGPRGESMPRPLWATRFTVLQG